MSTLLTFEHRNPVIKNMNFDELLRTIEDSFLNKTPLVLWGLPSIGKSKIIENYANDNNIQLKEINLNRTKETQTTKDKSNKCGNVYKTNGFSKSKIEWESDRITNMYSLSF